MLTIRNLQATINPNFTLGPLSFTAHPGQILTILGENGSGKTSLFRALLSEVPTVGTITLNQTDLLNAPPEARAKAIAIVPQIEQVPFHFTVRETVIMGCLPHNSSRTESNSDHEITDRALADLRITYLENRFIHEISGGERQKTLIARALAQNPQILLLDEPTAHVDLKTRHSLKTLISELAKDRIVLVTTHDLAWGTSIADSCLILANGQIEFSGPTHDLDPNKLEQIFATPIEIVKQKAGRTFARPADHLD